MHNIDAYNAIHTLIYTLCDMISNDLVLTFNHSRNLEVVGTSLCTGTLTVIKGMKPTEIIYIYIYIYIYIHYC